MWSFVPQHWKLAAPSLRCAGEPFSLLSPSVTALPGATRADRTIRNQQALATLWSGPLNLFSYPAASCPIIARRVLLSLASGGAHGRCGCGAVPDFANPPWARPTRRHQAQGGWATSGGCRYHHSHWTPRCAQKHQAMPTSTQSMEERGRRRYASISMRI